MGGASCIAAFEGLGVLLPQGVGFDGLNSLQVVSISDRVQTLWSPGNSDKDDVVQRKSLLPHKRGRDVVAECCTSMVTTALSSCNEYNDFGVATMSMNRGYVWSWCHKN